jgi:hypothetical protein
MYSKRPKPADRNPLPNKLVRVESKKIVIPNKEPVPKKSGPIDYLGKPKTANKSTSAPTPEKSYETVFHGVGKYVGSGKDVWAFVWLDDFDTPPAANDEGIKN